MIDGGCALHINLIDFITLMRKKTRYEQSLFKLWCSCLSDITKCKKYNSEPICEKMQESRLHKNILISPFNRQIYEFIFFVLIKLSAFSFIQLCRVNYALLSS